MTSRPTTDFKSSFDQDERRARPAGVRLLIVRNGMAGHWPILGCLAAMVMTSAACSPGPMSPPTVAKPMNKPVPLGSESGSGAVESERRKLQGTWDLIALETMPANETQRVPVQASGTLVYDEFGNLTIDAHTTDPAAPVAAREVTMLSFKGRAVIDVDKHELKLMDLTGNVDPDEVLSPERRRRFDFVDDTLRLSSFDDAGTVTAIATWRRRPPG